MKKEKRNCYINWSQLYNFVIKDYGLTEIGVITKNVLDKFWTVLDMSKTCPKPSPALGISQFYSRKAITHLFNEK